MSLHDRVATTRRALHEIGRGDLADTLVTAEEIIERWPDEETRWAVSWRTCNPRPIADDEILMRRAAAIASLAEGFNERGLHCERCISLEDNPGCTLVTRSDFLARHDCEFWSSDAGAELARRNAR